MFKNVKSALEYERIVKSIEAGDLPHPFRKVRNAVHALGKGKL